MVGAFLLILRDVPLPREYVPPFHIKKVVSAYWLNPIVHRDFALTWLARYLMFLGYTTVVAFMFYFLQDAVHYTRVFPGQTTAKGVNIFFTINGITIIIASLVGGIISDRLQRRKLFVIAASLVIVVGLLLYAFFLIWSMVLVATVILGIGVGVYLAVDFALASQVIPAAADRGKDIGIIEAAVFVPMILSPIVAGITLNLFHSYLALFVLLAVGTLIAAVLIVPIKSVR